MEKEKKAFLLNAFRNLVLGVDKCWNEMVVMAILCWKHNVT